MKMVIEQLEDLIVSLKNLEDGDYVREFVPCYIESVEKAIAELKSPPRWETPEQWKERTGAELPDDFPVWERCVSRYDREPWSLATYDEAKDNIDVHKEYEHSRIEIICATEAGCPPDDWAPEGR